MKYISEQDIQQFPLDWNAQIDCIKAACFAVSNADYSQPIKPYLRFRDLSNRIIAMPAFIGGELNSAGLKWIASFPKNLQKGLQRAHSVIILNDVETGAPYCIINSGTVSGIRTAAVTGLMLKEWLKARTEGSVNVGMTGFRPIGRLHYKMARSVLGDRLKSFRLYDLNPEVGRNEAGIERCES